MGGFTATVTGLKELDARLTAMGQDEAKRCIRKSLRAGAVIVQQAIQERAPVRADDQTGGNALPPGALKNDIQIHSTHDGDNLAIAIGCGSHTAHVGRLIEYGHRIVTGGTSTLTKSGQYRGKGKEQGFVTAAPYIRSGYEASRAEAVDAMMTTLAKEIEASSAGKGAA
jgi:HK97 gp10 family phage protein